MWDCQVIIPILGYNLYMSNFSERLKELRIENKLSLEDLSKAVKIGSSSLCRWENNQADIKSEQLILLAKFFKVSTDYLLGLVDY